MSKNILMFLLGLMLGVLVCINITYQEVQHKKEMLQTYVQEYVKGESYKEAIENMCKYENECDLLRESLPKDARD